MHSAHTATNHEQRTMSTDPIYTLSTTVAQAQAMAAMLAQADTTGLEPEVVQDYATALGGLLHRVQDLCIGLHDCEIVPIRNLDQLHRVRALRAELETLP
jgi:hypothetical protein